LTAAATQRARAEIEDAQRRFIGARQRAAIATLRAEAPLDAMVDTFLQQGAPAACIVDRDGVLVGVLDRQNLAELTMIKSMRPDWRFDRAHAERSVN
jgi:CBS-domain-containing membrane protein